jgi:hypothetical protein
MRLSRIGRILVVGVVALTLSAPASAQDDTVDAATLEALCEQNAPDATALEICLDVVHTMLVPGSASASGAPASGGPAASFVAPAPGAPVGTTLAGDGADVTLVEANWDPDPGFMAPAEGNQYVAVFVKYLGTAEGATYNFFYWNAVDQDGTESFGTIGVEPYLKSGDLAVGTTAEGWVSFEVPVGTTRLDITQAAPFGTELVWTIER